MVHNLGTTVNACFGQREEEGFLHMLIEHIVILIGSVAVT